jgi:hypothetical protein
VTFARKVHVNNSNPILFYFISPKVNEMKKIQCKGGTQLGEANPTWLKQPNDKMWFALVSGVALMGLSRVAIGYWRLATGKGKIED